MSKSIEEQVKQALNADLDLSEEEYKAKNSAADNTTKAHGVKGRGALTEAQRHKRMSMNYMGSSLNLQASTLAQLNYIGALLEAQNAMLAEIYQMTVKEEQQE